MRLLTSGQIGALAAEAKSMAWLVTLDTTTTQRLTTASHDITFNGDTYYGIGGLVAIEDVKETDSMEATGYRLLVTMTSSSLVSLALSEHMQGVSCEVVMVLFDGAGQPIGSAIPVDTGVCDELVISDGVESCAFSLGIESEIADFARPNVFRYTNADQQQRYADDRIFEFTEQMAEKAVAFPSAELQRA